MMIKPGIVIGAIIMTFITSNISVYDSNGNEDNTFRTSQSQRPAINPDFAPNYSCLFDVSQIHCIPGSAQECPKPQFSAGDPQMCFPKTLVNGEWEWEWECPEDYHSREDDESGQCYPDSEGCEWDGYGMIEREDGEGNTCSVSIYCLKALLFF